MANKNPENKFGKDRQPENKRGKAKRTLFLEAIKDATGKDEKAFYHEVVKRAMDSSDPASSVLMKEVLSRLYPASKPTMPLVEFELTSDRPMERVLQIEKAIASGTIPADVAKIMVDIIKSSLEIEKITELAERIANIEKMLNESSDTK